MPIYEYVCADCGHEMEVLQKMSDEPLRVCPACQAESLKKKVSAAGFRLAGSGWYETDFKSSGKRNLAGGGDSKPKADGGGASAKNDSPKKSEAKNASGASS